MNLFVSGAVIMVSLVCTPAQGDSWFNIGSSKLLWNFELNPSCLYKPQSKTRANLIVAEAEGKFCKTEFGYCRLLSYDPVGSECTCVTPDGSIPGTVVSSADS